MQDASSKQQMKQKYKPNHQQTGQPPHSALPIRGRTKKQKLSTNFTYKKLTQTTWSILEGRNQKGRKNSTLKPGKRRPQTHKFKKKMKRQRSTTQMKEQTRNTEVQINGEEIGKLPEK